MHILILCPLSFTGVSLHERGFGFVQYTKEAEAVLAVQGEHGGLLKGRRIGKSGAPQG